MGGQIVILMLAVGIAWLATLIKHDIAKEARRDR